MTKAKIKKVLKSYLENKTYLYYENGMYPSWVTRDELIDLITIDLLDNAYNEEEIKDITYCYYDYKKSSDRNTEKK